MKYSVGEWGSFLSIRKGDSGKVFDLIERAVKQKKLEANKEFGAFLKFLGSTPYFDIKDGALVRVFLENISETETVYNIIIVQGYSVENKPDFDRIMENINKDSILEIDPDLLWNMFEDYKKELKDGMVSLLEMGKGVGKSHMRREKLKCGRVLYKVRAQDVIKLKDYIEYYFVFRGEYYIKSLPGVLLDEFYDRADIKETDIMRFSRKSIAVQK